MCGHDYDVRDLKPSPVRTLTGDLAIADRLISEACEFISRIAADADPVDAPQTHAEAVILANALDNFRRRDQP